MSDRGVPCWLPFTPNHKQCPYFPLWLQDGHRIPKSLFSVTYRTCTAMQFNFICLPLLYKNTSVHPSYTCSVVSAPVLNLSLTIHIRSPKRIRFAKKAANKPEQNQNHFLPLNSITYTVWMGLLMFHTWCCAFCFFCLDLIIYTLLIPWEKFGLCFYPNREIHTVKCSAH